MFFGAKTKQIYILTINLELYASSYLNSAILILKILF